MSKPRMARRSQFLVRTKDEPHDERKKAIIKAHPSVTKLMGPDYRTKYIVLATVLLQVGMAALTRNWCWTYYLAAIYVVGATANHSLFLAIHELSHNLGSKSIAVNKYISMVANLPICIAYCITFKPYHMEHHRYQGVHLVDTDIPSSMEAFLVTDQATCYVDHCLRKAIFMFFQIFAYALRPCLTKPELVPKDKWIVINWMICLSFDMAIVATLGPNALLYMLLSTFFAGSIHPTAGHFIAEHYVVENVAETYSYYGWLNCLTYNVGYHNEHHDFPNIPWSRLPEVRKLAPEFYDHLPQCKSWPGLILRYIFDDGMSPYSRVKKFV